MNKKTNAVLVGIGLLSCVFFVDVKAGNVESKQKFQNQNSISSNWEEQVSIIYDQLDFGSDIPLSKEVFKKAYQGYANLKSENQLSEKRSLLSIVDMNLSANQKRLWVIDLEKKEIIFHSLVSHGQGTGEEFATKFSNKNNSHQSSTGFYITENPYFGSNGYSLRLHGMDKGFNDNAYARAIVIHGAPYVSEDFIKRNKRLGRSWGCPAVPQNLAKPLINTIKDKTCLYVHYEDEQYFASSKWLNQNPEITEDPSIKVIDQPSKLPYFAGLESLHSDANLRFDSLNFQADMPKEEDVF